MSKLNSVVFPNSYPSLDLHGFDRQTAKVTINDFILDNKIMGNEIITIVHGIGTGALKDTCHLVLKRNPSVIDFRLDNFNVGMTIVLVDLE